MPTYCNSTQVLSELPNHNPEDITATYITEQITFASAEVEGLVGRNFPLNYETSTQKFPNIGSSPATPELIQQCAIWLTVSRIWVQIYATSRMAGEYDRSSPAERYRSLVTNADGTGLADLIRNGIVDIVLDGEIIGTTEDIAYGEIKSSEDNVVPELTLGRYNRNAQVIGDEGNLDNY